MADSTKVKTCPTGKILKGGKCVKKLVGGRLEKVDIQSFKTKGYDKATAKVKSNLEMTPEQRIAAYKAKKAKADTSRGKSALQLAREAAARHKKRK